MEFNAIECGQRISKLRIENNLKQIDLAQEVFLSERSLRRIERGEIFLTVDSAVRLANYFHVSIAWLILGEIDGNDKAKMQLMDVITQLTIITRNL